MRPFDPRWLAVVALFSACSRETPSTTTTDTTNQSPAVWVQGEHVERSADSYSVRFTWGGVDPDGDVSHYEYRIVASSGETLDLSALKGKWTTIRETEKEFTFANDGAATQTFIIRAVDNEMLPSDEPDYITVDPHGLAPRIIITVPPASLGITPADIPPITTFQWIADASRPAPDSVQWVLESTVHHGDYASTIDYLRSPVSDPVWYPWAWYGAANEKGKSWTTPPLEYGDYVFAVRSKNVVGPIDRILVEPVNVRRAKVAARISGPTLTVDHPFIGQMIGASCDHPVTIVDMAAHMPLSFSMRACADHYGGVVTAYRYGWDILDPDDPEQWEIDYTPYPGVAVFSTPRAFSFGTHVFSGEVIDNSGYCSRVEIRINIVRFTGERNLLIVDDYRADEVAGMGWDLTNGAMPNDAEHDAFWLDMASDVDQFDPAVDMISVTNGQLPLTTIASYKTVIWNAFGDVDIRTISSLPKIYEFIRYRLLRVPKAHQPQTSTCFPLGGVFGNVTTDFMALTMQAGVHVLIAGNHPTQNVVPRYGTFMVRWPMIPLYELEPGSVQTGTQPTFLADRPGRLAFAYQALCLEAIDFAIMTNQRVRGGTGTNRRYCAVQPEWRSPNLNSRRDDGLRSAVPIDPNFPTIGLRVEAAGPGRTYNELLQSLDVEVYNPAYFRQGAACTFVPAPRSCFEPIYGLVCLDTAERTYQQPVAFWTGAYADVVAPDIPGAVAARSAVFGFPPVFFTPSEIKPAIEHILFDEWQLPRSPLAGQ